MCNTWWDICKFLSPLPGAEKSQTYNSRILVFHVFLQADQWTATSQSHSDGHGKAYPSSRCERGQRLVDCNATTHTCYRVQATLTSDKGAEARGCEPKGYCDGSLKEACENPDKRKLYKIEKCNKKRCYASDGVIPSMVPTAPPVPLTPSWWCL